MADKEVVHGKKFLRGLQYEGKREVELDEDRIINEGLSGGSVHDREDTTNIGEATPFPDEEPPHKLKSRTNAQAP